MNTTPTTDLTIVRVSDAKGEFHVHAAGCADLKRRPYTGRSAEVYHESHASVREVIDSFYGPAAGSFYEEAGYDNADEAWPNYVSEFWFAPCCADLPNEVPAEAAATVTVELLHSHAVAFLALAAAGLVAEHTKGANVPDEAMAAYEALRAAAFPPAG